METTSGSLSTTPGGSLDTTGSWGTTPELLGMSIKGPTPRGYSSIGQSIRLIIGRFTVQIRVAPRKEPTMLRAYLLTRRHERRFDRAHPNRSRHMPPWFYAAIDKRAWGCDGRVKWPLYEHPVVREVAYQTGRIG